MVTCLTFGFSSSRLYIVFGWREIEQNHLECFNAFTFDSLIKFDGQILIELKRGKVRIPNLLADRLEPLMESGKALNIKMKLDYYHFKINIYEILNSS